MTGRPERVRRKVPLQAHVTEELYEQVAPLATHPVKFRSFSHFFEGLVFSLKASFVELPGDDMPRLMRDIKAGHLLELEVFTRVPQQRRLHMTLDEEAIEFIDFLCGRYPVLFANRNEAVALILLYARRFLKDERTAAYFSRRVQEALRSRPALAGPEKRR